MSYARSLLVLVLLAALCVVGAVGCDRDASHAAGDSVNHEVTVALDKRFGAIADFTLQGTAEQGSEKLPFSYAMKQPTYVRASVGPHALVFDGNVLLVLDDHAKTADRRDLKGVDDAAKLMLLHQAFSSFTCEGWRPPLLRPSGFSVTKDVTKEGARYQIHVPIDDDTLKEEILILKSPGAELVQKRIVDKKGAVVTATDVTAELTDATTHLVFPKSWKTTGPDGVLAIDVDQAVVNSGISAERFKTDVPAGFTQASATSSSKGEGP